MNEVFFHFMETKRPYVVMKYAMTLDGKIACATGDSKWVTGEEARRYVHHLRKKYMGIMAGIGTVLEDDPMLNCRIEDGVDPIRIICDSELRIPLDCQLVETAKDIPLIVACREDLICEESQKEKAEALQKRAQRSLRPVEPTESIWKNCWKNWGEQGIDSILLEGGGTLNASMLEAGLVDKVYAHIAGKLVGGKDAKSPVEGVGIAYMKDAVQLCDMQVEKIGEDICISGHVRKS